MTEPNDTEPKPSESEPSAAALDVLWNRVLEAWEDDRPHAALLEHAVRNAALPDVAARYRALVGDVHKGPRAKRQLEAITVAAHSLLLSTRMPRPKRVPLAITVTGVAVCLALLAWLGWSVGLFGR
jgi:hypothetical protein